MAKDSLAAEESVTGSPASLGSSALVVDREQFAMWCEGQLLHFENGEGVIVNERACSEAEQAALNGGHVLFTTDGRLTGTSLVFRDGEFLEV